MLTVAVAVRDAAPRLRPCPVTAVVAAVANTCQYCRPVAGEETYYYYRLASKAPNTLSVYGKSTARTAKAVESQIITQPKTLPNNTLHCGQKKRSPVRGHRRASIGRKIMDKNDLVCWPQELMRANSHWHIYWHFENFSAKYQSVVPTWFGYYSFSTVNILSSI